MRILTEIQANRPRQYLEDISGQEEAHAMVSGGITQGSPINKTMLEDAARDSTLHGHGTPEERFWLRQQGKAETITVGKNYISKVCFDHWD
jgi:anoctamin-10